MILVLNVKFKFFWLELGRKFFRKNKRKILMQNFENIFDFLD